MPRDFFIQNQTIILFAQGLVFFSLGFAIWLQRRRATRLLLSSSLIWLAGFAFVEGITVWGRVFVPLQESYLDANFIEALMVLRAAIQVVAFVLLVEFGLRLLNLRPAVRRTGTAACLAVVSVILLVTVLLAGSRGWGVAEWEAAVVTLARYSLLLPGAMLSAVGLWRQRAVLTSVGMTGIRHVVAAAAAVLAIYGLLGGLIVEPGPLAPGGLGDSDGWFEITSFPLAAMRGIAGLALCVLAVKLLEIFDVEAKQQIEALDRARAIAEERARFGRDLHDGTIQSIYAAALHLEAMAIRTDDMAARRELRQAVTDLNSVTDGIRDYIRALAQPMPTAESIVAGLGEVTRRFASEAGGDVRFRAEGVAACGPLPDEAGAHMEQILREALSNTARHAGACGVRVSLVFAPDEVDLVVSDDGCGPPDDAGSRGERHQGIRNMRERARRLGGRLVIEPASEGGTRVTLAVPLDSDLPAPEPANAESYPEVTA